MPRRRTPKPTDIPDAVLDYFAGPARVMTPGEVDESMRRYKKALWERALGAELTYHLGSPRRHAGGRHQSPERHDPQDRPDRRGDGQSGCGARSGGHVRAGPDPHARAALYR